VTAVLLAVPHNGAPVNGRRKNRLIKKIWFIGGNISPSGVLLHTELEFPGFGVSITPVAWRIL